ncbi:MAG: repeat containing protein [Cyanobacteria bacterium RYN_339]|nr:repeat containing protein [Cyanobacteria bacterium RYN_339]
MRRRLLTLGLACLAATSGCFGGSPGGVGASKKPAAVKTTGPGPVVVDGLVVPAGPVVTLTGKVKIISDNGAGIISDNGAGLIGQAKGAIISDNGGGIISNNSGAIISDNGAGLISNNGGGLTSKVKRTLLATPGLAVYRLADASITLEDAAGHVLTDKAGHPVTAVSGKDGGYTLATPLPPGNLVAKIKLWNGGTLQAMVARDGAGDLALDLDTASTMGAAYVLGQFVKGDQRVFDKLPRVEAERLTTQLDVVRGYLQGAFKYDAKVLTDATDALRKREQGVDATIEEVKALLLGQAALGSQRLATSVPLGEPIGLTVMPDGTLVLGERFAGRVRQVLKDGTLETLADGVFGSKIQQNFLVQPDLALGPDGFLYSCSQRLARVYKLDKAEGTPVVGSGEHGREAVLGALATKIAPNTLAFAPDGTLYVGEYHGENSYDDKPPRILALKSDGSLRDLGVTAWGKCDLNGLLVEPDGALVVLACPPHGGPATFYRIRDGVPTVLSTEITAGDLADVARLPDGRFLISEADLGVVVRLDADGKNPTPVLGKGGAAASKELTHPTSLAAAPDGTIYVTDGATNLVYRFGTDGSWKAVAGAAATTQTGEGGAFAINQPMGLAEDDHGRILIAESGSSAIKRYANGQLELIAGGRRGASGGGVQASEALLDAPTGLAYANGTTWLLDGGSRTLQKFGPDGVIDIVAGRVPGLELPAPGVRQGAKETQLAGSLLLALAPDGRPYWASHVTHSIARMSTTGPDAEVEGVVGKIQLGTSSGFGGLLVSGFEPDPAKAELQFPFGLAFDPAGDLYFCDAMGFRVYKLAGTGGASPRLEVFAGLGPAATINMAQAVGADGAIDPQNGVDRAKVALVAPLGLCFDKAGTMYVAEAGTRNLTKLYGIFGGKLPIDPTALPPVDARIRKITPDGTVTTIAGPGGKFFTNPKSQDALIMPASMVVDRAGRLIIVDTGANLVRILPAGTF